MAGHRLVLGALSAAMVFPSAARAAPIDPACAALSAQPVPVTEPERPLTAEDLVGLTDIGDPSPAFDSAGLSLSPDGRYLAFPVRRAQPAGNLYCLGIVLLDRTGNQAPRLLDPSDEFVWQDFDNRGTLQPHDSPLMVRPKWSPDGRWIAYQKSVGGVAQLWRVRVADAVALPVPNTTGRILDFAWSDNDTVILSTRSGLAEAEAAIAREAVTGYHYDERFIPTLADKPLPLTPADTVYEAVALESGARRPATAQERALLDVADDRPAGALRVARAAGSALAWTSDAYKRYHSATMLQVRFRGRHTLSCGPSLCDRIVGLWWSRGGERLVFVRREGWAKSQTGVYTWTRGQAAPVRRMVTNDLLLDCQLGDEDLICGRETALAPRSIISLRPGDSAVREIYDANPGFSRLAKGRVERLYWTNAYGFETYGDLVYPVGYVPGKQYPTIVTTYTSRGFLRGGTGDEYPIQLFANHGYAVLSFERPINVGLNMPGVATPAEGMRMMHANWADRRSVQSAIEGGLKLLDEKGVRDRNRTGITGLSDGTSTVQFALLNSSLFAAAAISSCCTDIDALMTLNGLATGDFFRSAGLPALDDPQQAAWSAMSFTLGARRMHTPLLMQMPGDEFRMALASFTALRERHQPVAMYVFPDEGHIKQQPAHRLAIYKRNLAWFDFWLKGKTDPGLTSEADVKRWTLLRATDHKDVPTGTGG